MLCSNCLIEKFEIRPFPEIQRGVSADYAFVACGPLPTLRDVVEFYHRGGIRNPWQTPRLRRPLDLTDEEIDALVAFLRTLTGEGPQDQGPNFFPQ